MRPVPMPHEALYNRWKPRGEADVITRMKDGLAKAGVEPKDRHDRCEKGNLGRLIGRTEGGMNTNLPAVTDANNRSLNAFMTAG